MRPILPMILSAAVLFTMIQQVSASDKRPAAESTSIVQGNNQFALDLYRQLNKQQGKNLFFSPSSISIALAMTMAGAGGETETEMARVLHLTGDRAQVHAEYQKLLERWNAGGKGYQLQVANRLWGEKDFPFLASYLTLTRQNYGAELGLVDFAHQAEAARAEINAWVEKQTHDKIRDLLPEGTIDPMTRLVLTNAVYFKGDWTSQFVKKYTTDADFTVSAGQKIKAPFMHQTHQFTYAEDESLQALELPYQGNELSMIVLLPKAADGLDAVEKSLTAHKIAALRQSLRRHKVILQLPKFKLETSFSLAGTLAELGMKLPFTAAADFSGMDGKRDLFLSAVVHKAYVNVDEQGTEAAAATGAVMTMKAAVAPEPPPVQFRADHPFIFAICDKRDGSILFIGRLVKPKD